MLTYGDYFTGMGMATAGFIDAGLKPLFGVEYDPDPKRTKKSMLIADMYVANFGDHIIRKPVQDVNPADLPRVDWFHASPVCKNASSAKKNGEEDNVDIITAQAVIDYFTHHKPKVVSIENVFGYRKFEAFKNILKALTDNGYGWSWHKYNMADFGVPQTRERLIVTAVLASEAPARMPSTHAETPQMGGFFAPLAPWVGWYEAIEDLIPTLPISHHSKKSHPCEHDPQGRPCRESEYCRGHFADWQLDKLPDEFKTMLVSQGSYKNHLPISTAGAPAQTVTANHNQRNLRAFLMNAANPNGNEREKYRYGFAPSKTVTSGDCQGFRAYIVPGGNASSFSVRQDNEPVRAVGDTERVGNIPRAFVIPGENMNTSRRLKQGEPFITVSAASKAAHRAYTHGRIVKMTAPAVARFQALSPWYQLSGNNGVDFTGLGNGVPSLFMQKLAEYVIARL